MKLAALAAAALLIGAPAAMAVEDTDGYFAQRNSIATRINAAIDARDYATVCLLTGEGKSLVTAAWWIMNHPGAHEETKRNLSDWDQYMRTNYNTCVSKGLPTYRQRTAQEDAQLTALMGLAFGGGGNALTEMQARQRCHGNVLLQKNNGRFQWICRSTTGSQLWVAPAR
ncbi:hypothetical protein [Synechococcus phage S-B68]|nr:hypothetical protein [Synechococcus phage S-B68]